jgi:ABC-2 type transport system permease protein
MFGNVVQPLQSWNLLQEQLRQDYTVRQVDLSTGRAPGDVDVLLVIAPQNMTELERFAVDQYLMRGGAVIVAGGTYTLPAEQFPGGLRVEPVQDGLADLLAHYGVEVGEAMVLDPRNEPMPVQVQRDVGGMQVVEIQELDYPYFVDVRSDGMDEESPVVSNLPAVTMHWVSPLTIDTGQAEAREATELLWSTDESWLATSTEVQPDPESYPPYGFPVEGEQASHVLAVSMRGSFESYYKEHASPFEASETMTETVAPPLGTVEVSPESARLVVIGSSEFIDDAVLDLSRSLAPERYLNNLQFMQNAVDWSVEDEDLLTIRSAGSTVRLLQPLDNTQKATWMGANYAVALLALIAIGVVWYVRRRGEEPMELVDAPGPAAGEDTAETDMGTPDQGGQHD